MASTPRCIVIETGARLHLGFYNFYDPGTGIAYGSIGVGLEEPRLRVRLCINGPSRVPSGAERDVEFLRRQGLLGDNIGIEVLSLIERHVGLGSTTQLRLSISLAATLLRGETPSIYELALRTHRGFVSGIGIEVFRRGGLVVDSGRPARNGVIRPPSNVTELPRAIARLEVPSDWAFIVILPRAPRGLPEGPAERRELEAPQPLSQDKQRELYVALIELLRAVAHNDIEAFGDTLSLIDRVTGEYFSKQQSARYCCRQTEAAVEALREAGGLGAGQSSWGPAAYAVAPLNDAEKIARHALEKLQAMGISVEKYFVTSPRNRGALLRLCD